MEAGGCIGIAAFTAASAPICTPSIYICSVKCCLPELCLVNLDHALVASEEATSRRRKVNQTPWRPLTGKGRHAQAHKPHSSIVHTEIRVVSQLAPLQLFLCVASPVGIGAVVATLSAHKSNLPRKMSSGGDASSTEERTPQPPPPLRAPNKNARVASASSSSGIDPRPIRPSQSATQGSGSSARRNPKAAITSDSTSSGNNNSPTRSPHNSPVRASEPATDEEGHRERDDSEPRSSEPIVANGPTEGGQLDIMEGQAVQMLHTITKRSQRNHQKYNAIRDNIAGKDKRMNELRASYEDFVRQTAGLEALCNCEMDEDTLEELFLSIPQQQRLLHIDG